MLSHRVTVNPLISPRTTPPDFYTLSYTTLFRSHLGYFAAQEEQVGRVIDPQQEQEQGDDVRVGGHAVERGEPGHVEREIGRDTSELQSHSDLVCRLLLEKKKIMRMTSSEPTPPT